MEMREIPGLPGYFVDSEGKPWSQWIPHSRGKRDTTFRPLKTRLTRWGYLSVDIGARSIRKKPFLHKLVLLAFKGPCPPGMEARHLNGKHTDNRPENLVWGTKLENAADKHLHGAMACLKGSRNGRATISEEIVIKIRHLREHGATKAQLMAEFNLPEGTLDHIIYRQTWKHV